MEHCSIAHDLKYPEFIIYKPQTGGTKEVNSHSFSFLIPYDQALLVLLG